MVKKASSLLALGLVLGMVAPLTAHKWLTCYSGAPGQPFYCGPSCHCYPGGTISVQSFPARYQPGQTYTIGVTHVAGDSIEVFNCSIKIGWGSVNAGLIQPGYLTAIYVCSTATGDGVCALDRCETCNFLWTAPPAGADTVRLYLAGIQGYEGEWGRTTQLILASAEEISGAEEQEALSPKGNAFSLSQAGENPSWSGVALAYRLEGSGPGRLRVYDLAGCQVKSYAVTGLGLLRWDGRDASGHLVPGGIYFFRLEQGSRSVTCKALLVR